MGLNKTIDLFKKAFGYILLDMLKYVSGMQEMCDEEVRSDPRFLPFFPDCFRTPWSLKYVPDWLKTQGMCERVVKDKQGALENVSDHFKIQGMCDDAVRKRLRLLEYVPDYFVTQQQVKLWHDNAYYCNDNGLIKWYKGYHK